MFCFNFEQTVSKTFFALGHCLADGFFLFWHVLQRDWHWHLVARVLRWLSILLLIRLYAEGEADVMRRLIMFGVIGAFLKIVNLSLPSIVYFIGVSCYYAD